jgi:hypothetical protein
MMKLYYGMGYMPEPETERCQREEHSRRVPFSKQVQLVALDVANRLQLHSRFISPSMPAHLDGIPHQISVLTRLGCAELAA